MSDKVVKVAFIGAGSVNFGGPDGPWDHASRLEKIPNVIFVGISDPNKDRCEVVLNKRLEADDGKNRKVWEHCQIYSHHSEMIKEAKPDAVYIGVPPFTHGSAKMPMELDCVKAGVHCFVEKPMSNAPADETLAYSKKIEETAGDKVVLSVGYMFRHSKWARYLKNLVAEHGRPIVAFDALYNCAYSACNSPFFWDVKFSGGPIVEQATHFVCLFFSFNFSLNFK